MIQSLEGLVRLGVGYFSPIDFDVKRLRQKPENRFQFFPSVAALSAAVRASAAHEIDALAETHLEEDVVMLRLALVNLTAHDTQRETYRIH